MLRKHILAWVLAIGAFPLTAQQVTLQECYELARQNYPLIRQQALIARSRDFTIANAHTANLPQLGVFGQATYQSDVTRLPLASLPVEPLSKDQYIIYAEVNQQLFDGGTVRRQSAITEANATVENQKLEVELYKIRDRVNQLYFGMLMIGDQLQQTRLIQKDIESSRTRIQASIEQGVAFRNNADVLEAENLKVQQRIIELTNTQMAYAQMLSLFIGKEIKIDQVSRPEAPAIASDADISRPELLLYTYQNQLLTAQHQLTTSRIVPRVNLFVRGGYGRPALNLLKNQFESYYLGGIRFSWNLGNLYTSRRDRELLQVGLQTTDSWKEAFLLNTRISMRQQQSETEKLRQLMEVDQQLIALRSRITSTAKTQLEHGVITANDYLRELNAEDQARQNLLLHQTQLLMAQFTYQNLSGN